MAADMGAIELWPLAGPVVGDDDRLGSGASDAFRAASFQERDGGRRPPA